MTSPSGLRRRGESELVPVDEASVRRAERVLARYAARVTACPSSDHSEERPSAVKLRYVTRSLAPWPTREDETTKGDPHVSDSDWIVL